MLARDMHSWSSSQVRTFRERYGPWAIVTGASSGIGEALARELSAEGISVVLVARRRERLEGLARELREKHGTDSLVVELDLGAEGAHESLMAAVADRDVGLLCANAGFGEKGSFQSIDLPTYRRMIRLNCEATVALVHAMVPRLLPRQRSGILIVASTAAFQGVPWTTVYGATKAFDLALAEGLSEELGPKGVDVVAVCPGATDTEGPKRTGVDPARVPFGMGSAEAVAKAGLSALGRSMVVVPRATDRLAAFASRIVPRSLAVKLAGRAIRRVIGTEADEPGRAK
jgi:uncharacterized protein